MKAANQQNLTVRLHTETIRKAKVIAAKRSTSVSGLVTEQIEDLVGKDEAYESAKRSALARLERGFHMGGVITATRDELHER
jgi:predicted transcriptional regulator